MLCACTLDAQISEKGYVKRRETWRRFFCLIDPVLLVYFGRKSMDNTTGITGAPGADGQPESSGWTSKKTITLILLVVGVLLLMYKCGQGIASREGSAIGRRAPAFQLKDLQGNDVSLDQFRGKIVMLDFWATWCGPCRVTMPLLEELQQEHPNDFTLLAVNVGDAPDMVAPYVQQHRVRARVLLDEEGIVGSSYGSESIPMQVLIDQKGIIRHIQAGYYPGMKEDLWSEIARLQH